MIDKSKILKKYFKECEKNSLINPFSWLKGRTYSESFVICIGAGPWRFGRRQKVQGDALKALSRKDIANLVKGEVVFPLKWQNDMINNAIDYLNNNKKTFNKLCKNLKKSCTRDICYHTIARNEIRRVAGCKQLPKVLSLFCRDSLKINAFPIDRHVKRKLLELDLPTKEDEIIRLCRDADLNPRIVATAFVRSSSNMDNPDWSV